MATGPISPQSASMQVTQRGGFKYRAGRDDPTEDLDMDIGSTLQKYQGTGDDQEEEDQDQEQESSKRVDMPFVDTLRFNMMIGVVIFVNMIVIGLEQDLGYKFTTEDDLTLSPTERISKRFTWYILENVFCLIFLGEMLMRMHQHRIRYFNDMWNCLDFFLVMTAVIDTYILSFIGGSGKVRMLMSLRVVRMLRLVRFVRMLRMFRELWLIVNGLLNSMKTLGWVGLLLVCVLYVCAIFLTTQVGQNDELYEGLTSYDGDIWPHKVYFGKVPRSMFTLFQILTLDSWCDDIVRHIVHRQPYMAVFFVFFLFLTTFGLMNIIVGVIVENTLGAAQMSETRMERAQEKQRKKTLEDLHLLFQLSDTDGSGQITKREFQAACRNPRVLEKLEQLGLLLDETDTLFRLLDPTKKGSVDLNEFITTCKQLIGGAKQKDIIQVGLAVETLTKRLDSLDSKFSDIEQEVGGLSQMTAHFLQDVLQPLIGFDSRTMNLGSSIPR